MLTNNQCADDEHNGNSELSGNQYFPDEVTAGSYPGILLARITPILALKRKFTHQDSSSYLIRKVLVTTQFAISIML
ncbi:MAG: hypothetical protein AAFX53_08105, partial [Bacteroidota bacterium]